MSSSQVDIQSSVAELVASGLSDEEMADQILANLGKRDLKQLAKERLETERRWREEQIRYYEPYDDPNYQRDFHSSIAKTRFAIGSNRSGKTTVGVAEFIWWATGMHPYRETPRPPVRLRVCCTDFEKGIEQVMLPKYREFVRREDLLGGSWESAYSKQHRVLSFANGSFIEYMSYDQDVEKFGGASRHAIHEDEPAPGDIHDENQARLIDTQGETIMTLTPVNLNARTSWTYDLWLEASEAKNPNLAWFFFDIYKNRSLSKEYIDDFATKIKDPGERMARIEGKFPQFAGLVFKEFSRAKNVIKYFPPPQDWTRYLGIDPHAREATHVAWLAVDPSGNKYVYNELREGGTAKVIVPEIKARIGKDKIEVPWMDNAAKSPDVIHGRSVWLEFVDPDRDGSNKGIYAITVENKQEDRQAFIRLMRDLLGLDEVFQKPKFFVMDNCPITIHEFETCIYDDWKSKIDKPLKEQIKKKGIHMLDCIQFILLGGAEYVKYRKPGDDQYSSPYAYLNRSGK